MNIVCQHCATTNRIPDDKDHSDASCGKCQQKVYSSKPVELDNSNFYSYVENNDLPIVVDFWASWCGPCQNMAPVYNKVAENSSALLFAKVNTEKAQQISADAGIRSLPTLVFFYKGAEVDRISGGLNEMQMKQWLIKNVQKISD